jgi:hypothetical protein
MTKDRTSVLLLSGAILALPFAAISQTSSTSTSTSTSSTSNTEANRLATRYTTLAGSQQNITSLVNGLHNGTSVTLTSISGGTSSSTTFTPPTGKMGYGSVDISLALAQAELAKLGITNPTPAQLQAALTGGSVTTSSGQSVQVNGILSMRAGGKGWGQIAQSMGFKLGDVVRSSKADAAPGTTKSAEQMERVSTDAKPDKVERPNRPEKVDRPQRPDRPERASR